MDTIIEPVIRPAKRSSYRRHTVEFKRAVVEQSLTTGASVSRIAREHNVNANQVLGWRKLFKEGLLDTGSGDDCKLLPVALAELPCSPMPMRSSDAPMVSAGVIQLEVGRARLRIEGAVSMRRRWRWCWSTCCDDRPSRRYPYLARRRRH